MSRMSHGVMGGKSGKADPYCKVFYGSKELLKTKTIKKSLDPEWYGKREPLNRCRHPSARYQHDGGAAPQSIAKVSLLIVAASTPTGTKWPRM